MRVANAKTAGIVPTVFYEYLSIFSVLTLGLFARQSAALKRDVYDKVSRYYRREYRRFYLLFCLVFYIRAFEIWRSLGK